MSRWLTWLPLGVLAALGVLFVGYALRHDPHVNPAALVGRPVPRVAMRPLDGGPPQEVLAAAKGPMLVNFYFSTCAPCLEEEPALMALKAEGTTIVGVAYKDPADRTRAFLNANGNPFATVLMDPDGRASVEWGVTGAPETFAVNASGMIVAKHSGALTPEIAEAMVERLAHAR